VGVKSLQEVIENIEGRVSDIDTLINGAPFRVIVKGHSVKKGAPPLSCASLICQNWKMYPPEIEKRTN